MSPVITKINGPPGTGKTTFLINKVEEELKAGILPQQIIFTSFTRSAAREAATRAISRFPDFHPDDFVWFSTLHSICFRLLNMNRNMVFAGPQLKEFCSAYGYELTSANTEIVSEEFDSDMPNMLLQTDGDYYEFFINWFRNKRVDFETGYNMFMCQQDSIPDQFNKPNILTYIKRRNEYKLAHRLYDFADMIILVLEHGLYPRDAKVLFSDEYQDCSPLLAELNEMWMKKMERVFICGDPYQALYQFMAAEPSILINTKADTTSTLKQSYRCPRSVHAISRRIVERFQMHYDDDNFTPRNADGSVTHNIQEYLDWVKMEGKIFYLHRTNWLVTKAYQDLLDKGVPFKTTKGFNAPLQNTVTRAISCLYSLLNAETVSIGDVSKLMDYISVKNADNRLNLRIGAKTETKKMAKDNPSLTANLRDLPALGFTAEIIRQFQRPNPFDILKIEPNMRKYFAYLIRDFGVRSLIEEPRVTLGTIHSVKGQECDTCIVNLGLTRQTYSSLMQNPDPEHRIFYVAVTRSRNKVILLDGEKANSYML
jgi:DNA helicase II / ATP-dependent DNA helicase PcrA